MRRILATALLLSAASVPLLSACGQDKMDRGIPDHVDSASPVDPAQLDMTEEERQKQNDDNAP